MDQPTPTNPAAEPSPAAHEASSSPPGPGHLLPTNSPGPTTVAVMPALSRTALFARIGLLGIATAAAIAALILAFGSSASPGGSLAANSGTGSNGSVDLLKGGGPGFRGGHGFGFGDITVTAISGNNLALQTADGWTRTITVDSGTTYSKAGATIALGDLKVGDQIGFRQTDETNGTWTIDSIVVILPHAGGEVTKISGSTITVQQRDGTTATITVNGQTRYSVNGTDSAALADVKVGMFLVAEGTKNSDGSLTAAQVRAGTPGTFEGPGGHFGRGFGPDSNGTNPNSTAAPSATGSAS
jgi:hypothetical protein